MHTIKRGLTSLFVCLVVLVPLILSVYQWGSLLGLKVPTGDPRKATALQSMSVRPIDKTDEAVKPFEQPLITLTFDDGWETIYTDAAPLLQKYGLVSTQYVLSGLDKDQQYMTFEQMKALHAAGHEIGCHSVDHANLTQISHDKLMTELNGCKTTLEKQLGLRIDEFASPFGASNQQSIDAIKQVFRSHRNTNGDITTNQVDDQDVNTRQTYSRYNIIAVTIRRDTTIEQLQAAIDYTVKNNGWLVLNYHQVDNSASDFGVDKYDLEQQLQVLNKAKARVVPMGPVLDVIEPQTVRGAKARN